MCLIIIAIALTDDFFIFFKPSKIEIPEKWQLVTQIDMYQMVYEHAIYPDANLAFADLNENNIQEMTDLVALTKPGPFLKKTIDLGNYIGVFEENTLIAMAGHRFHPAPYIEISAVCTHPEHLGKGHSYGLLSEQIKRILNKSQIPFLHVRNDNVGAIKLYEKIGFTVRAEMIAYVIKK